MQNFLDIKNFQVVSTFGSIWKDIYNVKDPQKLKKS